MIDIGHCKSNAENEAILNNDPKVLEYEYINEDWIEFRYRVDEKVAEIYKKINSKQNGIKDLA